MDSTSKTVQDASTETPARLRRMAETCDELPGLLADLSASQLASRAADGGWSVGWVVCHLRDVEEAYFERVGFILINERPLLSTFDPDRWAEGVAHPPELTYFPFSAGPHGCHGSQQALRETTVVAATVSQRWRLRAQSEREPAFALGIGLQPKRPLRLVPVARSS